MALITYTDKNSGAPKGTAQREWRDTDANEIKSVVNENAVRQWNNRGTYDASTNLFPATGGSGTSGAIMAYNTFTLSVGGNLGSGYYGIGAILIALVDNPGQTETNWRII